MQPYSFHLSCSLRKQIFLKFKFNIFNFMLLNSYLSKQIMNTKNIPALLFPKSQSLLDYK